MKLTSIVGRAYSNLQGVAAEVARRTIWLGRFRSVLSWCAALLVVYLIFQWIDLESTLRLMKSVSFGPLMLSLLLLLAGFIIRLGKWLVVLRSDYGGLETTTVFFVTKLAGGLLPARVGDMAPLARGRYRTRRMTAFLIVDRLFETYATLFLGALGFVSIGFADKLVTLAWLAVLLAVSAVFFALLYRNLWSQLAVWFEKWPVVSNPLDLLERLSDGLCSLGTLFVPLLALTFVATALDFSFVKFLYLSLGHAMSFYLIAAAWCTIGLASIVAFTPGGLGLADAPAMYLYGLYGVPEAVIGAGFVLGRTVTMLFPWLAFLVFWVWRNVYERTYVR